MRKKAVILIAVLMCCILLLSACNNPLTSLKDFFNKKTTAVDEEQSQNPEDAQSLSEVSAEQPDNSRPTVLYYKDNDNLLVPVMRYIPKADLGIAKAAITALIYTVESAADLKAAGLTPTIPMGTKILGAVVKEDGLAIIDFSKEFLNFSSKEAEEVGIKSLAYTLTEFPNIKKVEVRVEGKPVGELPNGTNVASLMKRSEINLQKAENTDEKLLKVMVYYNKKGSGDYSYFVPVTKLVSGYENSAEAALSALLEGPAQGSGMTNPFPEGTQLLGIQVKDGIAYVNFSQEILNTEGKISRDRAIIKSVTLTLKEFPSIKKVKIFVNGKTIENTDGVGADEYIDVPVFVNYYE